ncbi:MAG: glycoside hydrolase family 25 protein [Verrucomicrobiota bacterium]|nr:glycoside hydrolase family 25 protein [Verrucomicrobiota bacterium]
MKIFSIRISVLLLALRVSAFAGNSVVNLSHYDLMRPDFGQMSSEGIVGIIHEATYPPSTTDEKYLTRQDAAVRAGLLWGAYHYGNASDPVRQADYFLNAVERAWRNVEPGGRPNEVLLVLDFEKNGHYPGGTMRLDQAARFVDQIHERTGKYPGLYGGENRLRAVLNGPGANTADRLTMARCWLWVANYHYEPHNIPPWGDWSLWQYTGDGVCDLPRASYPKRVANVRNAERNIFSGTSGELKTFWSRHGWTPGTRVE